MIISLLTDAPKHNLALMKIAQWHNLNGDQINLNAPIFKSDYRYASVLFERNISHFRADEYGGPAVNDSSLNTEFETMKPYYDLYPNNDFSLGYTYRPCSNTCHFCKVPKMNHPDIDHHSIHDFYDARFKKICVLNNNTFQDPKWRETFEEIWDADLTVIDENGYDLRLIDDEKADALRRTRFATPLHFAWDRMIDEPLIRRGLTAIGKHKMRSTSNGVYVLIGYDTTVEEDLHRCQVIDKFGLTPYPMPFIKNNYTKRFKRFMNLHYYRNYKTIKEAWENYQKIPLIKNTNKQINKLLF